MNHKLLGEDDLDLFYSGLGDALDDVEVAETVL